MWQEIQDQPEVALRLLEAEVAQLRTPIRSAGQVILAGTGASLAACRAGQYAFMRYAGILPHVLPAADLLDLPLGPESLVILVSQSGASLETQMAVRALKERGVQLWGVTNNLESPLAQGADRVLWMNAGEEVSSATKTYLATLMLFLMLAGGAVEAVPPDLRQTLDQSAETVDRWAAALMDQPVIYFLGAGAMGPMAAQGALLMKEKTFLHVEGMSLSEFRHGNIEVVRPGLPILLLAATPALSAEAERHAAYLASLGAEVYLVTDSLPGGERVLRVQNSGDEVAGMLQVVVPLQMLSERIAVRKGYDVDGFRYIAKVVDQYRL